MEKDDVAHLEKRINELSDSLKRLAADTDFEELIKIIHRPGAIHKGQAASKI